MKIISLPDLHGSIDCIAKIGPHLAAVDLVILPGDLSEGEIDEAVHVLDAIRCFNQNILTVHGNWDIFGVHEYLRDIGINLHWQPVVIDGVAFAGLGGMVDHGYLDVYDDGHLRKTTAHLDSSLPLVFVCHQPPFYTRSDQREDGVHLGSQTIRAIIKERHPFLCLCGHIHENPIIEKFSKTTILNPGPLDNGRYGYIEIDHGAILDIRIVPIE